MSNNVYDVVIVGAGLAGSIAAMELGKAGRKVLILESGEAVPHSREEMMERFYLALAKTPEAPYGDNPNAPRAAVLGPQSNYLDQRCSPLLFGSTYERRSGGTMWHWMGTSLRLLPRDFRMKDLYGTGDNWPITYDDVSPYYDKAEQEIGVSADVKDQTYHGVTFTKDYNYPNPAIPLSRMDQFFAAGLKGEKFAEQNVEVTRTPAGRNSRPYQNRRVCAGNTNCVPICPIEAKYDATITLHRAFNSGKVDVIYQAVATKVLLNESRSQVTGVEYMRYEDPTRRSPLPKPHDKGVAVGRVYVIAGHGIETPKLLLNSGLDNPNIGAYLMDHPFFLQSGLTPEGKPVYPYRGPLSTAGIESLRDGDFRKKSAAFRIEIGNDGWALSAFDPGTTTLDWVDGTNNSGTNPEPHQKLFGAALVKKLNDLFTRQCRIGFEFEQLPVASNRVMLSDLTDDLGLRRPKIHYDLTDYEKQAFVEATNFTEQIFKKLGVVDPKKMAKAADGATPQTYINGAMGLERSKEAKAARDWGPQPCDRPGQRFTFGGKEFVFMGAGHVIGTYRMGTAPENSVVNRLQRSWQQDNLYLLGSGVFTTSGTANPSLTIAALSFWAAETINKQLK